MGDDTDVEWLTYDEAAHRLGIKADSVRRRAAARKWPRRVGNDKLARVGIPRSIIPDVMDVGIPDTIPDVAPDVSDESGRLREQLASAETEARMLRERVEDLRADRDAWRAQAERLASERRPVGVFARLFGGGRSST